MTILACKRQCSSDGEAGHQDGRQTPRCSVEMKVQRDGIVESGPSCWWKIEKAASD